MGEDFTLQRHRWPEDDPSTVSGDGLLSWFLRQSQPQPDSLAPPPGHLLGGNDVVHGNVEYDGRTAPNTSTVPLLEEVLNPILHHTAMPRPEGPYAKG